MLQTSYKIDSKKYPRISGVLLSHKVGLGQVIIVGEKTYSVMHIDQIRFRTNLHTGSISITDGVNFLMSKREINKFLPTVGISSYGDFLQHFAKNATVGELMTGIDLVLCKFSKYSDLLPNS